MTNTRTILFLTDPASADPALAGGKGANLVRLTRAGFPVPEGFLISSAAYRNFLMARRWDEKISSRLKSVSANDPVSLESASAEIRGWFADAAMDAALEEEIRTCYRMLGSGPVAVRSSATAEDLPDLSFAGQQDTYLNISGEEKLIWAICNCWGSLWTARAIGYRARNHMQDADLALAVIVQCMVPSEFSGVLFTANPLTGARGETVIDAIPGLGEALVSGQMEPDHYVVQTLSGKIRSMQYGSRRLGADGTVVHTDDRGRLSEEQVHQLATLGAQVAVSQDGPQDMEWAFSNGKLFLLQARPITSLYPVPDSLLTGPPRVMFSFGGVQGLMDPITPLGQDSFQRVICGLAGIAGFRIAPESQTILLPAGERLWINITALFRHKLGRKLLMGVLGFVDPAAKLALRQLADDPLFAPHGDRPPLKLIAQFIIHLPPIAGRVFRYLLQPKTTLANAVQKSDLFLQKISAQCAGTGEGMADLEKRVELIVKMTAQVPEEIPAIITGLMAGMISFNLTQFLSARWLPEIRNDIPRWMLEATRGLPNNVTTEMDLSLFAASRRIHSDPPGCEHMRRSDVQTLSDEYGSGTLPPPAQRAIVDFMERFGMRGLAEVDLGRPRWREDPSPVMQTLQSYLAIEDGPLAPDRVFARGAAEAERILEEIFTAARKKPGGRIKERILRFFAGRMRALMGLRESPKFLIIRMMGSLREAFLESGRGLQAAGVVARADDIFYLHLQEIRSIASGKTDGWESVIASRHALFERERSRRHIPRLLLSDGRAVYESIPDPEKSLARLSGSPVSPGVAEGRVRVIRDPRGARLEPGEILVCPGTDPSWTPLFLSAGGLVMEVGGLMTHGSVVAREYGIPAVVGVDGATERLTTGQKVRVDGTRGLVEIIDPMDAHP